MRLFITQETDWLKRNPHQQHHLAEMLSLRGHEIRVLDIELRQGGESKSLFSKREVFPGVSKIHRNAQVTVLRPPVARIPCLDYASLLLSHRKEIKRQIKEFAPDAIVGFGILNSYLGSIAARQSNRPFIYYWIDVLHQLIPERLFQPVGKWLESRILRRADRVLTINDKLKEYVIGLGAASDRTFVLGAGIDTKRYNPATVGGRKVRERMGIDGSDTVLFFMGWLYHFSGLKEVALEMAKWQDSNLKLLIVGDGDAYDALQQIREKSGLQDRIILAGKKPYQEIPAFIAAADICLLPAYPWEATMRDIVPIKMYEYMAMSKPVIASRLPGLLKEFGDDNGVVYIDRPEAAIAKAVELIQDGKVEELGDKSRLFVERHDWEHITDEFERILEEAIKEKQNGETTERV